MADQTTTNREQAHDLFQDAMRAYTQHLRDEIDSEVVEIIADYLSGRDPEIQARAEALTPVYYSEIAIAFSVLTSGNFGHERLDHACSDALEAYDYDNETDFMMASLRYAYEYALQGRAETMIAEIANLVDVAHDLAEAEDEEAEDTAIRTAIESARVHRLTIAEDLATGQRDRVIAVLSGYFDLAELFQ